MIPTAHHIAGGIKHNPHMIQWLGILLDLLSLQWCSDFEEICGICKEEGKACIWSVGPLLYPEYIVHFLSLPPCLP